MKKILSQEDANMLETELDRLVSRAKIDVYKMNILPSNWKDLYNKNIVFVGIINWFRYNKNDRRKAWVRPKSKYSIGG